MNLAALDLNLLVALDALLAEASVGRAALRLGLSQPATSHALRRLRTLLDDPLLVRVGPRMELTPRAEGLRLPLREALDHVQGLFADRDFQPATSTRRFRLMMPDHVGDVLLPVLVRLMAAEAPLVSIEVLPWRGPAVVTPDLARSIDLIIACVGDAFAGFHRQTLFRDTDAAVIRRGHPAKDQMSDAAAFLALPQVAVVGRGQREDLIDTWLGQQGLSRRIALTVPSYLQALHVIAATDLAGFLPRRLAEQVAGALRLDVLAPPIDAGSFEEYLFYPTRHQVDPASIWLRQQVTEAARSAAGSGRPVLAAS
jgi:DNA-binding transcriptional LysR family regulator